MTDTIYAFILHLLASGVLVVLTLECDVWFWSVLWLLESNFDLKWSKYEHAIVLQIYVTQYALAFTNVMKMSYFGNVTDVMKMSYFGNVNEVMMSYFDLKLITWWHNQKGIICILWDIYMMPLCLMMRTWFL